MREVATTTPTLPVEGSVPEGALPEDEPPEANPSQPPAASGRGSGGSGTPAGPSRTTDPSPLPPAPTPTPEPTQPPGCAPCEDLPRTGQVVTAEAPFAPLAGVRVSSGSASATTGADGRFSLPPPSASAATVTATAAGRNTTVLATWYGGDLTLHLSAAPGGVLVEAPGGAAAFEVSGRVVQAGQPVAGALVTASGASPTTSGADGRFTLRVLRAAAGELTNATVWGAKFDADGSATRLGTLGGLTLAPGANLGDVALQAPSGSTRLAGPLLPPFAATARWTLAAVAADGSRLVIASSRSGRTSAPVFDLPGMTYEAEGEASGLDGASAAFWRQPAGKDATLDPGFVRPPEPGGKLKWAAGESWLWRPIPEVDGYRVEAIAPDGTTWEAFSSLPRLTLPAGLPSGPNRVRIVAASEGGLRAVASLRALRLFPLPIRYSTWQGTLSPGGS